MFFLPIVERELRVASRRKSTHRVRLWTTLAGLVVSFFFMLAKGLFGTFLPSAGPLLFKILTDYAFGLSLLAGVLLAADCVSEEKREGTLGLLFLTDLKGYDVVLGKLMAVGLSALYGLVAVLPVTALPLLMGGVTGAEYWRVSLALVNTLFFSLATGILVSTSSREATRAMGKTLALLVLLVVLLPALGSLFSLTRWPAGGWYVGCISPTNPFLYGLESKFIGWPERYWISLAASHLFAWALLGLAGWCLPRLWQDKPLRNRNSTPVQKQLADFPAWKALRPAGPRAPLRDENPVLWLAGGDRGMLWRVWGITVVAVAILVCIVLADRSVWSITGGAYVMTLAGLLLKVLVAFQASRFFVEARRSGALELILSTPLTSREIIHGQWLAMKRIFLWPVIIVLVSQLLVATLQWSNMASGAGTFATTVTVNGKAMKKSTGAFRPGNIPLSALTLAVSMYGLGRWGLDVVAIGWLGMWLGLSARKPNLAVAMTILFAMVLPTAAFCVPNVVIDLFLILWAREKLIREFRIAAMPHYHATFHHPGFVPPPHPPLLISR